MTKSHHSDDNKKRHMTTKGRDDAADDAKQKYAAKKQGAVLKVDDFAHRKGVVKGLLSFRERKETKRLQTSKQLRSYKKAMKKEGYEPGTGASRKRVEPHDDRNDDGKPAALNKEVLNAEGRGDDLEAKERAQKTNITPTTAAEEVSGRKKRPFPRATTVAKANKKSDQQRQQQEDWAKQREEREKQKEAALKQRRQRHKLLTARTAKGQPVMKNLVQDILNQLQKEKK